MGAVYLGGMIGPGGFTKLVALKRMHDTLDPDARRAFMREASLAARIEHTNVVNAIDVVWEGAEIVVAMEFVVGESLDRLLRRLSRRGSRVPPEVAASIAIGLLLGLHATHELKDERGRALEVVHRDVSPHNVIVGADGTARLIDFGVARITAATRQTSESLAGKVAYLPPEVILGAPASRRGDVFAAATVLWEMLTGERRFEGTAAALAQRDYTPRPPSTYAPNISIALNRVTLKGMAEAPEDRFATALEMARELEVACERIASPATVSAWLDEVASDVIEGRAEMARRAEVVLAGWDEGITCSTVSMAPAAASARRGRVLLGGIGLVVSLAVLGGLAVLLRPDGSSSSAASQPAPTSGREGAGRTEPWTPASAEGPADKEVADPSGARPSVATPAAPTTQVSRSQGAAPTRGKPRPKCAPRAVDDAGRIRYRPECFD
jgi:eukaryotic-like serine/threonine-protein kinase